MPRIRLALLVWLALPAAGLADSYKIQVPVPVPKFLAPGLEFESTVPFLHEGFGDIGVGQVHEKKTTTPTPVPLVNVYFKEVTIPKVPDILGRLVDMFAVTAADLDPDEGEFALASLPGDVFVSEASLVTWNLVEHSSVVSLITNLNQVPTTIDLGYGPLSYEWDFATLFPAEQLDPQYVGRYYLIQTRMTLGDLIPEPTTACLLLLAAPLVLSRARHAWR